MIYLDEPWLTVSWDEYCQAIRLEWKMYVEGEQAFKGLEAGLALLHRKRTSRWLADVRHLGPVRQVDQQWINNDWFPRAISGGLRYMATVTPRSAIARMSVRQIMSKVNEVDVINSFFDDLEQARNWLRGQGK
jgi:hypothetical protein